MRLKIQNWLVAVNGRSSLSVSSWIDGADVDDAAARDVDGAVMSSIGGS